ncbi:interferon-induced protein 44-like [Pygocentrus nattereri]|uniref:G domain-containing protein n=1 Tax=Pygocentrus nattereri TaxID=42514 RepID=A0AAR2JUX5_PYGNA|nr:interferon-induced protein 44-like [Pygocentrus nattereri]XP_017576508.1 interferon-induced protein 44-like [Pygocentrus nattereri]XP_017576509.1 interferon-induced protein 44-like [Pygocentrus nattereri]XP_037399148.1 interferon-induced protein 44-like [Pygocentrus nattereri]
MGLKKSKPQPIPDFERPWRVMDWNEKEHLEAKLRNIQLNHPELRCVRILLHGPVGAGKSCFINSVQSVFHGEIKTKAFEQANAKKSCTKTYKAYTITNRNHETLPFVLNDIMGLEQNDEDGIHPDDVVNALLGHIKDGYKFNPVSPLSEEDPGYIREPRLKDKVHCLVSVVPASSISRMDIGVIKKMEVVRKKAMSLGIPHVIVMTKVDDDVCPLVNRDLNQIYRSRKIKEKMQICSNTLGPPMKCIFPVSNYHEENNMNNTKDVLVLTALLQIVKFAKDYVEQYHTTHE